jgi:hypothetical protein
LRIIPITLLLLSSILPSSASTPADTPKELLLGLLPTETVNCETNGNEGRRILAVYLYPAGAENDYMAHADEIRKTLSKIDRVWDQASDPYDQHPRWRCSPKTRLPEIVALKGPAIGGDGVYTLGDVAGAMAQHGFDSKNRIYLIFADHIGNVFTPGGTSTVNDDDGAGPTNASNAGPAYSMIDAQGKGWKWAQMWSIAMHELGHGLGAVQCSAPHASCEPGEMAHHHCWDDNDVMCHNDGGSYYLGPDGAEGTADDGQTKIACPYDSSDAEQWDCGKDDYFNIAPVPGSYLATHWNLSRSGFVTPRRTD